jgi:hypothetical protein
METRAAELAGKFEKHGHEQDAQHPYWWGRNEGDRESHRFVVRPAPSEPMPLTRDELRRTDRAHEHGIPGRGGGASEPERPASPPFDTTAFEMSPLAESPGLPPANSAHTPPLRPVVVSMGGVPMEFNMGVPPGETPLVLRESGAGSPPPLGTTAIVPPQEQPPQIVGTSTGVRGAVQGRATLTVTFADVEAVKQWLNGQSPEIALVFAARAALRIVPTITFGSWPGGGRKTTREIVLRVFRALAAAWAVAAYPGQRNLLRDTARAALFGLGDIQAPFPVRAAAYASAAATGEEDVSSRASTSVAYALDAAGSKSPPHKDLITFKSLRSAS